MENKISVKDERLKRAFWKAIAEIEKVLDGKKKVTDTTKVAVAFSGISSRIFAAEMHEEALQLMMERRRSIDLK